MLIRELFAIPAVIPTRNSVKLIPSLSISRTLFHFKPSSLSVKAQSTSDVKTSINPQEKEQKEDEEDAFHPSELPFPNIKVERGEEGAEKEGFFPDLGSIAGEKNYDKDPEFADILNSCVQDPQKGRSRVEERMKKKRNKILHTKTGSTAPMNVTFNKFSFNNSYIWFEFYNAPLPQDISLISDAIRCWRIVGCLGGCNSMNLQLSKGALDKKVPKYDSIKGANENPTSFDNIGDLEIQDNLARVWVDIGTHEPLLLDIFLNALTTINSDYVGIKQVVFGGSQFEEWKDDFSAEAPGCSVHKI